MKYISENALRALLKDYTEQEGLRETARQFLLDPGNISKMVSGKRPISKILANSLGYQPVIMYKKMAPKK